MTNEDIAGIIDLDEIAARTLDGSNFMIALGVPVTKEELSGTIGGSPANDEFTTKYPIYPANSKTKAPIAADVTAYTRVEGSPNVDTEVAVTAIATGEDAGTGYTVYNTVQLTTPPVSETDDAVLLDYHAYNDLYVQTSAKPKEDQDTNEIKPLGTKQVYTKYGSIKTEYEVECIVADLKAILLTYQKAADQTGVESGYTLYQRRDVPQTLKAFIPLYSGDETDDPADREELGRIYLQGVKIPPVLPEAKGGDDLTVKLTLTVGSKPNILAKTET